jgi:hypothetical protein|tara:strand:- start:264 stop:371 length:108 start_codon:yes stop_codon:yes gene_type:complete
MPQGKGTYGTKRGRPPKKSKKKKEKEKEILGIKYA